MDVDMKTPAQSIFARFAEAINKQRGLSAGVIYAEMELRQLKRRYISTDKLAIPYLGMRAWAPPKRGVLWNKWLKKYLQLYDKYCEVFWTPDILHAHSILAGIAAQYIAKERSIPFILTEHMPQENILKLSRDYHRYYAEIAENAGFITTVSRENQRFLQEKLSREISHIPNFINTEFFQTKRKVAKDPVFISIGEPAYTKGLDILLRSFIEIKKQLPNAILILVDKIRDRAKYIDPIIRKHKLKESVVLTGILDREEVRKLLQSASVYISASRMESFGLTMIESLSVGTPLVATKTAGSMDIVDKSIGRIVPQEDEEQLRKAILDVYIHRNSFKPQKLHDYVEKKFSHSAVIPQWLKLYQDV